MKPPESFVPLTAAPAPSAPREFKVAILNGHSHGSNYDQSRPGDTAVNMGFQSLETRALAVVNGTNGVEKKVGEPKVTVQRDGDRVTHLRIQCSCGMIMDLACVYDTPSAGTGS